MILDLWHRCISIPLFGKWFFSRAIRRIVPYTGSISPKFLEIAPGVCRVQIKQHRYICNHLSSIHAVALINLAEAATGIALYTQLPSSKRAILVRFEIDFIKKARGAIEAGASILERDPNFCGEFPIDTVLINALGETVAQAKALWLISDEPAIPVAN